MDFWIYLSKELWNGLFCATLNLWNYGVVNLWSCGNHLVCGVYGIMELQTCVSLLWEELWICEVMTFQCCEFVELCYCRIVDCQTCKNVEFCGILDVLNSINELWYCGFMEQCTCGFVELLTCGVVEFWNCEFVELQNSGQENKLICGIVDLYNYGILDLQTCRLIEVAKSFVTKRLQNFGIVELLTFVILKF